MTVKQGPMQQLHAVYKHGGVRGVFRGLTLTVLREVPGFGVYVVVYEWCTRSMRVEGEKTPHVGYLLAAGGFAGMTSWFANIPIDIVKSCIQSDDIVRPRYRGTTSCDRATEACATARFSCIGTMESGPSGAAYLQSASGLFRAMQSPSPCTRPLPTCSWIGWNLLTE